MLGFRQTLESKAQSLPMVGECVEQADSAAKEQSVCDVASECKGSRP